MSSTLVGGYLLLESILIILDLKYYLTPALIAYLLSLNVFELAILSIIKSSSDFGLVVSTYYIFLANYAFILIMSWRGVAVDREGMIIIIVYMI